MNINTSASLLDKEVWQGRFFTGQWSDGDSVRDIVEPATGKQLGQVGMANAQTLGRCAAEAFKVQPDWASRPYDERSVIMRRAADLAEAHADEIAEWIVRESGSTRAKAGFEVSVTVKAMREASALPSRAVGEVLPSIPGRLSLARRRPLGVVGVISPFNFPLYLAMRAVAPALALGNAVVLKPDPRTAVCGGVIIARLFEMAGLPDAALHVLPGDGEVGAALTSDPNVAMIQFTGSTVAGRKVGESAGRHLKKVSLELGGKNSLIVLDDANLDIAVVNAAWGSYLHQGQICMSTGRMLVQRGIYDRFVNRLATKAASMTVGDPAVENVTLGPLINVAQRDHVMRVIDEAQRAGARLEAGGRFRDLFFEPTVLSNVMPENPAFDDEIFGPVAVVTPFDTEDEAIYLANRTEYGLSMAIITADVGRGLHMGSFRHRGRGLSDNQPYRGTGCLYAPPP